MAAINLVRTQQDTFFGHQDYLLFVMAPYTQKREIGSPSQNADCTIWKDLLKGDKNALASIYSDHFDKLYNYGCRISKDAGIVEDAIQDLFIELWNRTSGNVS